MTTPRRTPAEPENPRLATTPLIPDPQSEEKDPDEIKEPYDLPFPDCWPSGRRPEYVIVVDDFRSRQPGQPASLAELLESRPSRNREPEPDLEAEP